MTTIVNLTPHPVRLLSPDAPAILPAVAGGVRVAVTEGPTSWIELDVGRRSDAPSDLGVLVPQLVETYGDLVDLPPPTPGTIYLLSQIACRAAAQEGRTDCRYPAKIVRRPDGEVSHCEALGRVPTPLEAYDEAIASDRRGKF